jgi:hypothetical protein
MLKIQEETLQLNRNRQIDESTMLSSMTKFFDSGAKYFDAKIARLNDDN